MPSPLDMLMQPARPGRLAGLRRTAEPDNSGFLATVKLHLKLSGTAEDTLLQLYINAAVRYVEQVSRHALLNQTWTLTMDTLPGDDKLELYNGPVQSVTSFTTYDTANTPDTTFSDYVVDTAGDRLLLNDGASWPVNLRRGAAAVIVYVSGYGATTANLPPSLLEAVLMLVGYFYVNRDVSCNVPSGLATDVQSLVATERRFRL